jgi:SSS family solute:Na+ symporter
MSISFVNAPLLATFLFGMFWRRTSAWGGFFGLLAGIIAAATHYLMTLHGIFHYSTDQAGNFWRAAIAFGCAAFVTFVVSLITKAPSREDLEGLVYGQAADQVIHKELPWYERPVVLGAIILILAVIINIIFW